MNFIEVERHKQIIRKSKSLGELIDNDTMTYIDSIIAISELYLQKTGEDNYTVLNPTKIEFDTCRNTFLIYVKNDLFKKIKFSTELNRQGIRLHLFKHLIWYEFRNHFETTHFGDDLEGKFILLRREVKRVKKANPIHSPLSDCIRREVVETFRNQNKSLIEKYAL